MEVLLINFYLPWYPANLPVKLDLKKRSFIRAHTCPFTLLGAGNLIADTHQRNQTRPAMGIFSPYSINTRAMYRNEAEICHVCLICKLTAAQTLGKSVRAPYARLGHLTRFAKRIGKNIAALTLRFC